MAEGKKVTRIKASDDAPKKASKAPASNTKAITNDESGSANIFARIGGYFKGAWVELRQVRWPNRRTTWSLTLAVLVFTAFFVVLIVLLDSLFSYIFNHLIV